MKRIVPKLKNLLRNVKTNLKVPQFDLKLFALFLNILIFGCWRLPSKGDTGMISPAQNCLFAHTLPPFMILLPAMLLSYLLGTPPSRLFLRIFLLAGSILFATTGAVVLHNCFHAESVDGFQTAIGVMSVLIAVALLADELLNEGMCPSKCCVK